MTEPVLKNKKALVLDLDGTVYLGEKPIDRAVNFVKKMNSKLEFFFVTNNTSRNPQVYINRLKSMGIECSADHLLTPTRSVAEFLQKENLNKVYCSGSRDFLDSFQQLLPQVEIASENGNFERAEAVVLAYDTELDYRKISEIHRLLMNPKVRFFATHPDLLCPAEEGFVPDVGSFLALFKASANRRPERIFGKPDPKILAPVLQKYAPEELLAAGDRIYTDFELAKRAQIDFALVLSGESSRADVAKIKGKLPKAVLQDLGDLFEK